MTAFNFSYFAADGMFTIFRGIPARRRSYSHIFSLMTTPSQGPGRKALVDILSDADVSFTANGCLAYFHFPAAGDYLFVRWCARSPATSFNEFIALPVASWFAYHFRLFSRKPGVLYYTFIRDFAIYHQPITHHIFCSAALMLQIICAYRDFTPRLDGRYFAQYIRNISSYNAGISVGRHCSGLIYDRQLFLINLVTNAQHTFIISLCLSSLSGCFGKRPNLITYYHLIQMKTQFSRYMRPFECRCRQCIDGDIMLELLFR